MKNLHKQIFILENIHLNSNSSIVKIQMKYILTIAFVFILSSHSLAQKVFSVEYENQADVKVFVV